MEGSEMGTISNGGSHLCFIYICQLISNKMHKTIQLLRNFIRVKLTDVMFNQFLTGLHPGGIAIDCGANIGDIAIKMAKTGIRVIAFEPNPYAFQKLSGRINGYKNLTCINKGVWDRNIMTQLHFHREAGKNGEFWSFASSIFSDKHNVDPSHSVEVELIDLTEFIEKLDHPVDLLKIDIEGAECEVLEKFLLKDLQYKVKLTLVETHDRKIPGLKVKTDRIRQIIKEKGVTNIKLSWL
jgi:FkbM family methyltransferase